MFMQSRLLLPIRSLHLIVLLRTLGMFALDYGHNTDCDRLLTCDLIEMTHSGR